MEKLEFKTIEKQEEINEFLDKVQYFTSVRLPLNYANNSTIVGVFLHEKLVAGYMLVTKPAFRSLLFVPDSVKRLNPFFSKDSYEMMEVNGLWIGPAVKTPKLQFRIWLRLLRDVFLSRKKYLLLMSNVSNRTIEKIHSLTNPITLYEGAPFVVAGESTHQMVRVAYTTRWNAVLNIPKYWMELRNREQRVSNLLKQKAYM